MSLVGSLCFRKLRHLPPPSADRHLYNGPSVAGGRRRFEFCISVGIRLLHSSIVVIAYGARNVCLFGIYNYVAHWDIPPQRAACRKRQLSIASRLGYPIYRAIHAYRYWDTMDGARCIDGYGRSGRSAISPGCHIPGISDVISGRHIRRSSESHNERHILWNFATYA